MSAIGLATAGVMCVPLLAHGKCAQFGCDFTTNIAHIKQQHCAGAYKKDACFKNKESRFADKFCGQDAAAALKALCEEMLKDGTCQDHAGAQGRTIARVVLNEVTGLDINNKCKETASFAVVYDPANGTVITSYPGGEVKGTRKRSAR